MVSCGIAWAGAQGAIDGAFQLGFLSCNGEMALCWCRRFNASPRSDPAEGTIGERPSVQADPHRPRALLA